MADKKLNIPAIRKYVAGSYDIKVTGISDDDCVKLAKVYLKALYHTGSTIFTKQDAKEMGYSMDIFK